jgi:hypothetical protein
MHVRERVRQTMCAPVCVFVGVRACAVVVCVRMHTCGLARLWVHARLRARSACVRFMCACVSVCAFGCVRASVLFRGTLGLLRWYLRGINGTRGVLEGTRGVLKPYSCFCQVALEGFSQAHGVLRGAPPESAYVRLTLCIFRGCMPHRKSGARHCTGALGELAPPEGYSTSTHLGFISCGRSLRVRLRRDADADAGYELPYPRVP